MKLLLAACLAMCLMSLPMAQVAACSCVALVPHEAAEMADAVFAGTVVGETPTGGDLGRVGAVAATVPFPPGMGQAIYTFEVDGVAKGSIGTQVEVLSGGDGASCGFTFGIGERWLVFTTWDGMTHSTGLCSGNVALEARGEAPLPLIAPSGSDDDPRAGGLPTTALVVLGLVAVVVAASWLAFRRGSSPA
jgi:hypothetical protein